MLKSLPVKLGSWIGSCGFDLLCGVDLFNFRLVLRSIGPLTPLKQSYVVSLGCRVFIIKPSLGSYSLMLVPPERSYAICSALKACAKSEGSRWTVVAGESNSKRGKTSSVKTLSSVGDVLSFYAVHQNIETDTWNLRSFQHIAAQMIPACSKRWKKISSSGLAVFSICVKNSPESPQANTPPVFKDQGRNERGFSPPNTKTQESYNWEAFSPLNPPPVFENQGRIDLGIALLNTPSVFKNQCHAAYSFRIFEDFASSHGLVDLRMI